MPINLNSQIKEVWGHPVGQDVLQKLMRHIGKKESWPCGRVASRLPVYYLNRYAGKGFAQALVATLNAQTACVAVQGAGAAPAWWKEAVFYRIYLPSFMDANHDGVGDVMGIVQRLPYLKALGVTALWLSPFLGGENTFAPGGAALGFNDEYGKNHDFDTLAAAAKAQNIRLVLETNISGTTLAHPWFLKAMCGDEKYKAYYNIRPGTADKPPAGGVFAGAGAWRWHPEAQSWVMCLSGPGCADINWQNPEVKQEIFKALGEWRERGAAGFALSPLSVLSKEGTGQAGGNFADICGLEKYSYGTQLHSYVKEIRSFLGEDVFIMGEMPGVAPEMARLFTASCQQELNMVWSNLHLRAQNKRLAEEGRIYLQDIKNYFLQWQGNTSDIWQPLFFGSHNLPRMVSRIGANAIYRSTVAKMLATILLTLRGTPVVYQGEELGLPNTRFLDIADIKSRTAQQMYQEFAAKQEAATAFEKILLHTADHARTPMPWAAGYNAGFTGAMPWIRTIDGADHLNAMVQMQDKASVLNHYKKLIEIRGGAAALQYGAFNPVFVKNNAVFCYFRIAEGEKYYIEINITGREVPRPGRILKSQRLMAFNYEAQSKTLRPYEANVYYCE